MGLLIKYALGTSGLQDEVGVWVGDFNKIRTSDIIRGGVWLLIEGTLTFSRRNARILTHD